MSKKNKPIRVKLIVNPGAGIVWDVAKNMKLVTKYLKKNGLIADVERAKPKAKATPIARQAIKDGYKIVIAMGGDGTIEAVMRGMIGSKAHLGIVPVGVENNIAKSLGIPTNLDDACGLIASDIIRLLDIGQVKTSKDKTFYFFEMAGIGLSEAMYPDKAKVIGSELSALQGTISAPSQPEVMPKVFLNLDDERIIEAESMLVMVSNTPVFGKKFLVTPNASLKEDLLDISVFQDFSQADLLGYYAKMMEGGYSGNGKVQHYQARKIKVKTSPKLKIVADGIALGKGNVTIKMRPGALRVIAVEKSPALESPPEVIVEATQIPASPLIKKPQSKQKE